jgi:hypothetical protein
VTTRIVAVVCLSQISPLQHWVLAANIDRKGNPHVAVFTAYFDASGSDSSRVMTVAGFVSSAQKWGRFEKDWKSFLPPTVSMFHMTDFVTAKEGWESWKGPAHARRRIRLIQDLVGCIKLNTSQGFVGSVRLSEYRQVNREYRLREHLGSPYVFLSMGELGRLKLWADRKHIDAGKILCIFEDGDKGQSDLLKRARADEFNAIPQSKKDTRAFDSCDLVSCPNGS